MRSGTRLERALSRVARDLSEIGADFALVGGLAVSVHTEPRFTRDADLAVSVPDDRRAEAVVRSLMDRGYGIDAVVEQEKVGRLATARLIPPGETEGGVLLDLLFASSGIEPEIVGSAQPIEILDGLRVKVASLPHLIAMKVLSRDDEARPQDRADLRALLQASTSLDVDAARALLRLVEERGYSRGKRLVSELEELLGA